MINNPIIKQLPAHLKGFITDQQFEMYTAQNHAVWRYVMRQNSQKLASLAHPAYLDGLSKTGICIDRIPSITDMNKILGKIGWAAVAVDGFIPPAAFMEFQKHKVLVIAADIRPIDQIEYTPAPDIIHEAAGHAPIIIDKEYAEYLRFFGEIGSKAFSSKKDYELYEAIRHLSILKADPHSTLDSIAKAESNIDYLSENMGMPSEMALIRNLHWWTVEYGLIGELDHPQIYGAGLLSSIGESKSAMKDKVVKLPYSIEAMHYNFDITKPQPQLFVTPDFGHLNEVLREFANLMALTQGGLEGLLKAKESGNAATAEFSSGLQISGIFTKIIVQNSQAIYLNTTGPTTLCFKDKMLAGHGMDYHQHGFGSPIGRIKGALKPTRFMTNPELAEMGLKTNQASHFEFESGITVSGVLRQILRKKENILLMSFENCLVKYHDTLLFEPSWGVYDMAVGEAILSAYGGPADPEAYGLSFSVPAEKTHKIVYSDHDKELHLLYQQVRMYREKGETAIPLANLWEAYINKFADDWLLATEILETALDDNSSIALEVKKHLVELQSLHPDYKQVIANVLSD